MCGLCRAGGVEIVPQLVTPPESPFSGGMGCSQSLGWVSPLGGWRAQAGVSLSCGWWVFRFDWRFGNGFTPPPPAVSHHPQIWSFSPKILHHREKWWGEGLK